jgi:magnesium transporter
MTEETKEQKENQDETLYGVSKKLEQEIEEALDQNNFAQVQGLIENLHAADVADLIKSLKADHRRYFIEAIKDTINPDILAELEDSIRREVFEVLGVQGIAEAVSDLESDDALDVIQDLEDKEKEEVLKAIPAVERAIIEEVLTYPEDSAGRLMQREMVCVPTFWTAGEAVAFIRSGIDLPENFYTIYVVDPRHHPIGEIALSKLLKHPSDTPVSKIMDSDLHEIPVIKDQEEVAALFRHYGLVSAPVIDASGRIVGMITVDDVVDVIEQEAEEDIMLMAKVSESDFNAPLMTISYWRIRWLIITLVNTLLASFVISQFQASIQKITALSFLMTINAAMGGNSGMQVVTIVVRALATRTLREGDTWRAVIKEVAVGLVTSGFFSIVLGTIAAFWSHDIYLGIILAVALICNMLWAAFAGTILPIFIDRLGLDPAISAGPILTTTTDVFGYAVFLGLATILLV